MSLKFLNSNNNPGYNPSTVISIIIQSTACYQNKSSILIHFYLYLVFTITVIDQAIHSLIKSLTSNTYFTLSQLQQLIGTISYLIFCINF